MEHVQTEYICTIKSLSNDSSFEKAFRRMNEFMSAGDGAFKEIAAGPKVLRAKHEKWKNFERLTYSFGSHSYSLTTDGKYVVESGDGTANVVPVIHHANIVKPNVGFRPPNLGLVLTPSDSILFLRKGVDDQLPGTRCEGEKGCQDYTYLDSSTGYLVSARFDAQSQTLTIGGSGTNDTSFGLSVDGVSYSERSKQGTTDLNWTRTTRKVDSLEPPNDLIDTIPTNHRSVLVESSAGEYYGVDRLALKDIKTSADDADARYRLVEKAEGFAKPANENPTTKLVIYGLIMVAVALILISVWRKKP